MIKDIFKNKKPVFSFEVFPPKKEDEFEAVYDILDQLALLSPDFISVTYGAGGSNSKKNLEIASYIQNKCHIEALAHLTSVGLNSEELTRSYENLLEHHVQNILALRGDRPALMTDEQFHNRSFIHASEMVKFLKSNTNFTVAGACYPEKHFESPSLEKDLDYLQEKISAGTDFLISQLFFDNEHFFRFQDLCAKKNIQIPISAGIMPITSAKQLGTTVSLSGSSVPKALTDIIANHGDHPSDMRKAGIDFAICQIQDLLSHGVDGIHIYTMNKPDIASKIIDAVR